MNICYHLKVGYGTDIGIFANVNDWNLAVGPARLKILCIPLKIPPAEFSVTRSVNAGRIWATTICQFLVTQFSTPIFEFSMKCLRILKTATKSMRCGDYDKVICFAEYLMSIRYNWQYQIGQLKGNTHESDRVGSSHSPYWSGMAVCGASVMIINF